MALADRGVAGASLRVAALVGRHASLSRSVARGALAGGADLVVTIATNDPRRFVERAAALRFARPDLVVASAAERGDADGLVDLAEALRFGCAAQQPRPELMIQADDRARARIAAASGLVTVSALPDIRTDVGRDALVARIRALRRPSRDAVLRDEAVEARATEVARGRGSLLVLDVGETWASLCHVSASGIPTSVHARVGIGRGADLLLARAGVDRIRQWIPRPIDAPVLVERVFNRALWPGAVPATVAVLTLEMALAREAIAAALALAERAGIPLAMFRAPGTLLLLGHIAELPRVAASLLVAIDGLELEGTTTVLRERDGALDPVAIVATAWPKRSATVRVTDDTGAHEERISRGSFLRMPTTGAVRVSASGADLRADATSLSLGVVVDARGRPLAIPPRDAERLPTIARWHAALDALPPESV